MLSSDKNVETIEQLGRLVKHYLGLETEYVKLDLIDKVVRLFTAAALAVVFFLAVIAVLLFAMLALAAWLSHWLGVVGALLVVAGLHVLLLLLLFARRKSWIERPLVHFLANLLMS